MSKVLDWVENTKKYKRVYIVRKAYQEYLYSSNTKLSDIYDSYTSTKEYAYNEIIKEMKEVNGYDFNIISYNCNMYTCGYLVDLNGDTYFIRHTAWYRDCIKVG